MQIKVKKKVEVTQDIDQAEHKESWDFQQKINLLYYGMIKVTMEWLYPLDAFSW